MIRCPCGSSLPIEPMIQCVDPHCGVLQHMSCVIVPDEPSEETTQALWRHYCEICRLNRADPFRATMTHLLSPVKLMTLSIPRDGSNPVQNVEKTFQLRKTDKNFLRHNDYNIQAWCMLLNDKVKFRMQWPLYADLKVNGVPVRTVTRPGSQLLGANGRDDGPMIAFYMVDGLNRISLSGWDARSFCLGVRIVKENTVQQILNLILNEQNNETFEEALARVQHCFGGGVAVTTEDSDSDLEVISDFVTVNLRCPMGGYRIKNAGRFRPCAHIGCFDLEAFVQLNQRSKKWQCPICLKNYSLEDITVDPYFNRIIKMMRQVDCEEDVTEIEVKFDGSWRVKKGCGFQNLEQWLLPDGRAISADSRQLKGEGAIGHIDDRKPCKLGEIQTMSHHQQGEHFGNYSEGVTSMSTSSFESHGEHNVDQNAEPIVGNSTASLSDMNIIVLSDSDEEIPSLMCPKAVDDVGHVGFALENRNLFAENLPCDVGPSSSFGIYGCKDNNSFMSQPTFAYGTGAGFECQPLQKHEVLDASFDSTVCRSNILDSPRSCDLNPHQSSSQKSPCMPLQSKICLNGQISKCTDGDNLTPFGCGSSSDGVNGAPSALHQTLTSALSVDKKVGSELTMDREHSDGPFSFPRRARSARERSSLDN